MDDRDEKQIIRLARKGNQFSKICEAFPQYDYYEVFLAIDGAGAENSLGLKNMITNRLNILVTAPPQLQAELIEEINVLMYAILRISTKDLIYK